jgi:hypothetical protein
LFWGLRVEFSYAAAYSRASIIKTPKTSSFSGAKWRHEISVIELLVMLNF